MQDAILCHELLHVERRDWLFTVGEEVVRAVFWFHPAIWWLLGEIQLAREQAVDREVVELTQVARRVRGCAAGDRRRAGRRLDLAPAPLFLRKRHLKQRVVSILKEVRMSKTRLISALAAGLGFLAVACWFVTGTFPLAAAPHERRSRRFRRNGRRRAAAPHAGRLSRKPARTKGVQGTVLLEVQLDQHAAM